MATQIRKVSLLDIDQIYNLYQGVIKNDKYCILQQESYEITHTEVNKIYHTSSFIDLITLSLINEFFQKIVC